MAQVPARSPPAWLYPLLPLLALLLAHLPGLARAWSGDWYLGCSLDQDRCDALYSLRLARSSFVRLQQALSQVEGPLDALAFLLRDLWQVAVDARALNILDMLLLIWPARLALPIGPGMVALHMGLLLAAIVAGYLFGRSLGASPCASAAAGLVAGCSGTVLTSICLGHYPQAFLATSLAFFAGLARCWRGLSRGVELCAAGLALSLLLYWQNALILGSGALLFLLACPLAGWQRQARAGRDMALALGIAALACLPAALPVLRALRAGSDWKLDSQPWGTPFLAPSDPGWLPDSSSALALLDAVPPLELLSPAGGWLLPALPLLPAVLLAARRRASLPWVLLVALASLLVLGPMPGGEDSTLLNPVYVFFHRWVPSAARMHHALRWGLLLSVGLCALTALGTDELRRWRAWLGPASLVAALAWVSLAGPWPLPANPFPGVAEQALGNCQEVLLAPGRPSAHARRTPGELTLLEGVHWKPSWPALQDPLQDMPQPSAAELATSLARQRSLDALLAGGEPLEPLPAGACVLLDPEISSVPSELARQRLGSRFGEPQLLTIPARSFHGQQEPRLLEVWRIP